MLNEEGPRLLLLETNEVPFVLAETPRSKQFKLIIDLFVYVGVLI